MDVLCSSGVFEYIKFNFLQTQKMHVKLKKKNINLNAAAHKTRIKLKYIQIFVSFSHKNVLNGSQIATESLNSHLKGQFTSGDKWQDVEI